MKFRSDRGDVRHSLLVLLVILLPLVAYAWTASNPALTKQIAGPLVYKYNEGDGFINTARYSLVTFEMDVSIDAIGAPGYPEIQASQLAYCLPTGNYDLNTYRKLLHPSVSPGYTNVNGLGNRYTLTDNYAQSFTQIYPDRSLALYHTSSYLGDPYTYTEILLLPSETRAPNPPAGWWWDVQISYCSAPIMYETPKIDGQGNINHGSIGTYRGTYVLRYGTPTPTPTPTPTVTPTPTPGDPTPTPTETPTPTPTPTVTPTPTPGDPTPTPTPGPGDPTPTPSPGGGDPEDGTFGGAGTGVDGPDFGTNPGDRDMLPDIENQREFLVDSLEALPSLNMNANDSYDPSMSFSLLGSTLTIDLTPWETLRVWLRRCELFIMYMVFLLAFLSTFRKGIA